MSVLVVAATPSEAAYVPAGLQVLITGVGKTQAAVATGLALAAGGITEVVNIGSAGALRPGLEGIHEIGRVLNHDLSYEVIRSFGADPQEWLDLDPACATVLATGDVFVSDPALRDRLAALADLVDMEGYAVAYAARAAGIPVRLVKHVSDNADARSLSWPELVDASARELGKWLAQRS